MSDLLPESYTVNALSTHGSNVKIRYRKLIKKPTSFYKIKTYNRVIDSCFFKAYFKCLFLKILHNRRVLLTETPLVLRPNMLNPPPPLGLHTSESSERWVIFLSNVSCFLPFRYFHDWNHRSVNACLVFPSSSSNLSFSREVGFHPLKKLFFLKSYLTH